LRDRFGKISAAPTASSVVVESIRRAIMRGVLQPGQRLTEEELAQEFGVSRTPVRDAFRLLEYEGVLEATPKRGMSVRSYQVDDLDRMYGLRACLEGYAAREAATRIAEAGLGRLHESCRRFEALKAAEDFLGLIAENFAFHDTILEAANDPRLLRMVHGLLTVPLIYRSFSWYSAAQRNAAEEHHRLITEALEQRDAGRAEALMKDHVLAAREVVIRQWSALSGGAVAEAAS
jgi:DNA-binding GntR family transcriptional regulator